MQGKQAEKASAKREVHVESRGISLAYQMSFDRQEALVLDLVGCVLILVQGKDITRKVFIGSQAAGPRRE